MDRTSLVTWNILHTGFGYEGCFSQSSVNLATRHKAVNFLLADYVNLFKMTMNVDKGHTQGFSDGGFLKQLSRISFAVANVIRLFTKW